MASIDMTSLSAVHGSEAADRRAKARKRSEWRLKAYGILAIALAALALGILISTVITKAATVVFEYYVSLETQIELDDQERAILTDPNPHLRLSLNGVVNDAMKATVDRKLPRRERRELLRLLSSDAGLELGDQVKATPDLIGHDYLYPALLDDEVQMYLKGGLGRLQDAGSAGSLRVAEGADGEAIDLTFEAGSMIEAHEVLREQRAAQARQARAEADRQSNAIRVTERDIAGADASQKAVLQNALEGFTAQRDAALARAETLDAIAQNPDSRITLTPDDPSVLVRLSGGWLKVTELGKTGAAATVLEPPETLGSFTEGDWSAEFLERPEAARNLSDRQIAWVETFNRSGRIVKEFNTRLLASSDSSNAELAGIWGAMVGSFWTMLVTFALAFPLGVMASIYLEEFAPKNRITDFIEVNINNLAAVPSIVFGLFGITVLISGVQLFGVDLFDGLLRALVEDPRSTPLAGGFVLALMSLPTIIIAARASIRAVPPSIRDAALGIGASKLQTSTHHVLPLAMPGILTGSIIAMAQALGETAPLIIIGMNSFIQEAPTDPTEKGNVLPSLIYLWNNNSERLFDGKTAMAILVLLIFLIAMNALAVLLRKRFERRW
ncbi:MAG: phosphate ABC transporter permease PstA [Pseudomonadota bacterium]